MLNLFKIDFENGTSFIGILQDNNVVKLLGAPMIKIAIYCPQGSGTLRQRLTILHILHILFILHILYILHILQIESSDCL